MAHLGEIGNTVQAKFPFKTTGLIGAAAKFSSQPIKN